MKAIENLKNTEAALNNMFLPHTTVLWRGTDEKLLECFDNMKDLPTSEWKLRTISTYGFTSTILLRNTSYKKEVQMVILLPSEKKVLGTYMKYLITNQF